MSQEHIYSEVLIFIIDIDYLEVPHDGLHGRLVTVVHEHDGAIQSHDGVPENSRNVQ